MKVMYVRRRPDRGHDSEMEEQKKDETMKTCTNSACRRSFSPGSPNFAGFCPHCGKAYPRIKIISIWYLRISGAREKIPIIKAIREVTGMGLAESKSLVESAWQEDSWLFTREMLPLSTLTELQKVTKRYGISSTSCLPSG